jgi:hypothetical protein
LPDDVVECGKYFLLGGDIDFHEFSASPLLPYGLSDSLPALVVEIHYIYFGALACKNCGYSFADPTAAAGHNCCFAVYSKHEDELIIQKW